MIPPQAVRCTPLHADANHIVGLCSVALGSPGCAILPPVRVVLSVPAGNERGPRSMEQALAAIHQANPARLAFGLDLVPHGESVTLASHFPPELRTIVEGQHFAHYPEVRIVAAWEVPALPADHRIWVAELTIRPNSSRSGVTANSRTASIAR
jgi:hypothetical protein